MICSVSILIVFNRNKNFSVFGSIINEMFLKKTINKFSIILYISITMSNSCDRIFIFSKNKSIEKGILVPMP